MFTKKVLIAWLTFAMAFVPAAGVSAIEGGESAKNHPRVVSLFFQSSNPTSKYDGCSAYLYSPRIVVTQAHCLFDYAKNIRLPASKVFVGIPGKIMDSRGKMVQVARIFMPADYLNTRDALQNTRDIAVMVTRKPVAKVSRSTPVTEEQLNNLVATGSLVTVGGYGLSSPQERKIRTSGGYVKPFKFPRKVSLPLVQRVEVEGFLTSRFAREEHLPQWLDLNQISKYAWVRSSQETGATCDGDSGAGFFIENGKQAIFVGANAGPMGSPNCLKDGRWNSSGGLNRIIPIFKYPDLLKSALDYEAKLK